MSKRDINETLSLNNDQFGAKVLHHLDLTRVLIKS